MCSKIFSHISLSLIINCYLSVCTGYRMTDLKFEMMSIASNETSAEGNEMNFFQQLNENKSITTTTENDNSFWLVSDLNNITETNSELQLDSQEVKPVENEDKFDILDENINDTVSTNTNQSESVEMDQINENNSQVVLSDKTDATDFIMYEKITLQRNNCNLEIAVQETHDLKIEIKFHKLENNTSGQCCITLNGQENNMLGVLISNVHLYGNASQGEVLKVITADYGLNFVLKEYYSKNKYEPLLLTETHKVYIVLYYKVTNVSFCNQETYFNLNVYSYKKYNNYIYYNGDYSESYSSHNQGANNLPATESSYFFPHFY